MLIVGICLAIFFSFLISCGYVVVYGSNRLWSGFMLGVAVFAGAGTALHVVIANWMGWSVLFPAEGKGLLLVVYYLDIFCWGVFVLYLVMRKFPARAKRIVDAAFGDKLR